MNDDYLWSRLYRAVQTARRVRWAETPAPSVRIVMGPQAMADAWRTLAEQNSTLSATPSPVAELWGFPIEVDPTLPGHAIQVHSTTTIE